MRNQHCKKDDTICWDCKRAIGNCPWSSCPPRPVKGWTAEQTRIYGMSDGNKRVVSSYAVYACPLFLPDEARRCTSY